MSAEVRLSARGLAKCYRSPRGDVAALAGVDLELRAGRTLAVVGESGCGKTTLVRALLRLVEPDAGSVRYRPAAGPEVDLLRLGGRELRRLRPELQVVFQNPTASLNPRFDVRELVAEAPRVHGLAGGAELEGRVAAAVERVGLTGDALDRLPHELSAGQRQRVAIARALVLEPRVLVCDEPTSALDVCVQARVLELLRQLQAELGIAYLFVAHDLAVVRTLAHEVAVMRAGRVVESGETERVFAEPAHEETRRLLDAVLPLPAQSAMP